MTILKTTGLTKKFGTFTALDGVNIEVDEGEIYGFIGPNGAGKSTTIRILLGMLKATSGKATIFGKDVWTDAVDLHQRIAYVPGDVNLWPNLTGGEVIDLFLKLRGPIDVARRDELIEDFQFDPTKKCGSYSKGNRQKIALISALAADVDLYILDEPTSGLDPLMERVFQDYVIDAKNNGKSILLSSHILSEVERLCDKVGIIREGQLIESGTLDDMRHLTRTNLHIETKEPLSELARMKGIHNLVVKNTIYDFQIDTEQMDAIMKYVSQHGIVNMVSTPPTLEDLFMRHYEGAEKGGAS
ncbi:ABC transporter ATP-binding protein [Lentibacillus saliphilus]|uniref:ABC transporter ATP-binding protein n=1 Tax=Lentibacillus saliphilus TaxID=2737028 RepID=UPI001C2FB1C6|nr:ABC transporter ATP-binding protein [Lentibacillus saliphilus]